MKAARPLPTPFATFRWPKRLPENGHGRYPGFPAETGLTGHDAIADIRDLRKLRRVNVLNLTPEMAALLADVSDDAYGLWEIDWFFNGRCPTWDATQRIELLSDLVKRGFVDVFFGRMEDNLPQLPLAAAVDVIRKWENWGPREPLEQPVYHVMTSDPGLAALRAYMSNR